MRLSRRTRCIACLYSALKYSLGVAAVRNVHIGKFVGSVSEYCDVRSRALCKFGAIVLLTVWPCRICPAAFDQVRPFRHVVRQQICEIAEPSSGLSMIFAESAFVILERVFASLCHSCPAIVRLTQFDCSRDLGTPKFGNIVE